jgi:hypothetical protein
MQRKLLGLIAYNVKYKNNRQMNIEWIDVEDKLPTPGVTVIVTGKGYFTNYSASVQRWERTLDGNWFATEPGAPYHEFKITHWHPMLEPPKKKRRLTLKKK